MQWLINIIKDWVIAQAYATEAWVLAKTYATQAHVAAAINVLYEWVVAQNYLQTSFVRRSPAGDWDWEVIDFEKDGAWHTLNCGTIVPAGAKAILFNQYANSPSSGRTFALRYPNAPTWHACPLIHAQIANVGIDRCNVVSCDSSRHIQYRVTAGAWVSLKLYILGWWL